jgi:hypothetical protein
MEDIAHWNPAARKALEGQLPEFSSSRVTGRLGEYRPLSFSDLRREEAATLIAVYRKVQDLDDGSAPARPQQLIDEVLEIIEARLAELSKP